MPETRPMHEHQTAKKRKRKIWNLLPDLPFLIWSSGVLVGETGVEPTRAFANEFTLRSI